jgi:hypothetical protein
LKGDKGDTGSKGDKGDTGPAGPGGGGPNRCVVDKFYGYQPQTDDCRLIFVTTEVFTGNLGGSDQADKICQGIAEVVNLWNPTAYRAFISDISRITHSSVPYFNLKAAMVAENWNALISQPLNRAIRFDQFQHIVSAPFQVWTGFVEDCKGWTSSSSSARGTHGLSNTIDVWEDNGELSCSKKAHLYCIEED